MPSKEYLDLSCFDISPERGFLPLEDPLDSLPTGWEHLDEMGKNLPELIVLNNVNEEAKKLPIPSSVDLCYLTRKELRLAWVRYCFIQSACVHTQKQPALICENVARPMWQIAKILSKPPILSYDGYVLNNWSLIDRNKGIKVDNMRLVQTFINDPDQAWFILIHVDIEYQAATAIRNLRSAIIACERMDAMDLEYSLLDIEGSLGNILTTMARMTEGTSPDTYHRIRPWIMSFDKVTYEGVDSQGKSRTSCSWRGQTGAQTSIFQTLEAGLQVPELQENMLKGFLKEMRYYMPLGHRRFIEEIEKRSHIRNFIISKAPKLSEPYNRCVNKICDFLEMHFAYAVTYIHQKTANPVGTGGSDFMKYLKGRLDERRANGMINI